MKNIPKAGLLIITLVIPALIFMFLRLFGRNHYDLPYFKPVLSADKSVVIQKGDTAFQTFPKLCGSDISTLQKLTVLFALEPNESEERIDAIYSRLQRLEGLKEQIENLQLVALIQQADSSAIDFDRKSWQVLQQKPATQQSCISEIFDQDKNLGEIMLIDKAGHVRGYYKAADSDEADRLMAEIKILEYENEK